MSDSAIAAYEQFLVLPGNPLAFDLHPMNLARAYRRLGELYEARNDVTRAVSYYRKFVELWKDADAELQPQVTDARRRISRLSDLEKR